MKTIQRFKIGEAFPASDPVARFITVLAMMSNDSLRLLEDLLALTDERDDAAGRRMMLFRQQASLYHEAASFIRDAIKRFPEIHKFVDGLPDEARAECEQVVGGIDPKSPYYQGDWLVDHRNVTFHYPKMHPEKAARGAEEIHEALTSASEIESSISAGESFGSVRCAFADEIVVQWLPDVEDDGQEMLVSLREAVMALARLVQRATGAYLDALPDGIVTLTHEQ